MTTYNIDYSSENIQLIRHFVNHKHHLHIDIIYTKMYSFYGIKNYYFDLYMEEYKYGR